MIRKTLSIGAFAAALTVSLAASDASAQQAVTLTLDPSSGDASVGGATNRLLIGVDALASSDSAQSDFSGTVETLLDISYDGSQLPTTTGLELVSGNLSATDVSLSLLGGFLVVDLTGLGASVDTPTPPGAVTGTLFDTQDHEVIVNQGNISAAGNNIDLSSSPVTGTTTGSGTLVVTLNNITNDIATYDVTLTLPVDFSDSFDVDNPLGSGTIPVGVDVGGGNVVASGQFTRVIPEPTSAALLGLGGLLIARRRRR